MLLGNDLAGAQMRPGPKEVGIPESSQKVFPEGVVTRAQAKRAEVESQMSMQQEAFEPEMVETTGSLQENPVNKSRKQRRCQRAKKARQTQLSDKTDEQSPERTSSQRTIDPQDRHTSHVTREVIGPPRLDRPTGDLRTSESTRDAEKSQSEQLPVEQEDPPAESKETHWMDCPPLELQIERSKLISEQENDPQVKGLAEEADKNDAETDAVYFYKKNGILMRRWFPPNATADQLWREVHQIVVPASYRNQVLSLAHDCPLSGHLGVRKTLYRIRNYFYWPGMQKDVKMYCRTCHICQVSGKPQDQPKKAALRPIPIVAEPFSHIIIDCVGPLRKSKSGHEYLFTLMCATTRYPVAIPMRSINARNICDALINFFSTYGLPTKIQSDQGSNFTSKVFKQLASTLGIRHIVSSAYHPQSQGALERMHQTLKAMLRTYCMENKDWSKGIPLLLFAIRETVQESLGFSPFELTFGHRVRGPLRMMQEKFLQEPDNETNLLDYVLQFRERLHEAGKLAKENLEAAQDKMKSLFDVKTQERSFKPQDKVLVFLPIQGDPLRAKYFGPYAIKEKTSPVNYVVFTPDRRKKTQLCHINMLKPYFDRNSPPNESRDLPQPNSAEQDVPKPIGASVTDCREEPEPKEMPLKLANSEILDNLDSYLNDLDDKSEQVKRQLLEFRDVASDHPSVSTWAVRDVDIGSNPPIKQPLQRTLTKKRRFAKRSKKKISHVKSSDNCTDDYLSRSPSWETE